MKYNDLDSVWQGEHLFIQGEQLCKFRFNGREYSAYLPTGSVSNLIRSLYEFDSVLFKAGSLKIYEFSCFWIYWVLDGTLQDRGDKPNILQNNPVYPKRWTCYWMRSLLCVPKGTRRELLDLDAITELGYLNDL